jgi:hypothetical protein
VQSDDQVQARYVRKMRAFHRFNIFKEIDGCQANILHPILLFKTPYPQLYTSKALCQQETFSIYSYIQVLLLELKTSACFISPYRTINRNLASPSFQFLNGVQNEGRYIAALVRALRGWRHISRAAVPTCTALESSMVHDHVTLVIRRLEVVIK